MIPPVTILRPIIIHLRENAGRELKVGKVGSLVYRREKVRQESGHLCVITTYSRVQHIKLEGPCDLMLPILVIFGDMQLDGLGVDGDGERGEFRESL